jgi:hypothetical protein
MDISARACEREERWNGNPLVEFGSGNSAASSSSEKPGALLSNSSYSPN